MDLDSLDDDELKVLDYVLNYYGDSKTRTDYLEERSELLTRELLSELKDKDLVAEEEAKDRYSNKYSFLKLGGEIESRDELESLIEEKELYSKYDEEESLSEVYENKPAQFVGFFDKVKRFDSDKVTVRSSHNSYQGISRKLEEFGYGYQLAYTTTTDNRSIQFNFRDEDARDTFLKLSGSIIGDNIKGPSSLELWCSYISNYVDNLKANSGPYSISEVAEVEKNKLDELESLPKEVVKQEVVEDLKSRIDHLFRKDSGYNSLLGYLSIIHEEGVVEGSEISLNQTKQEKLDRLVEKGLILKEDSSYYLTGAFLQAFEDVQKRLKVNSYPIDSLSDSEEALEEIMSRADKEIRIVDRYFGETALKRLRRVCPKSKGIKIEILFRKRQGVKEEYEKVDSDEDRFEIKRISDGEEVPHDRFMIIDDEELWQLGASINGLGKDFSTIYLHSEEDIDWYERKFDEWAENSKKLDGVKPEDQIDKLKRKINELARIIDNNPQIIENLEGHYKEIAKHLE